MKTSGIVALLLLIVTYCAAQPAMQFGILTGMNIEERNRDFLQPYSELKYPIGFACGLYGYLPLQNFLHLQAELYYFQSRSKYTGHAWEYYEIETTLTKKYVAIPVYLQVRARNYFYVLLGIKNDVRINLNYQAHYLNEKVTLDSDVTSRAPSIDFYYSYGIGKDFNISGRKFKIETKISHQVNEHEILGPNEKWKYRQYELLVGMELGH